VLVTVLTDVYRQFEATALGDALDDLCSPNDNYGWSSAGIYAFWRPDNQEVLYIGLANDLSIRFRQHNGLMKCDPKCCKVNETAAFFASEDKLGFSVFVQSPLMQTATGRSPKDAVAFVLNEQIKQDVRCHEGLFIELWRLFSGSIPPWNKVGGADEGRALAKLLHDDVGINDMAAIASEPTAVAKRFGKDLLKALTRKGATEIVAKSTIRELSGNPYWEGHEEQILHAARMIMVMSSKSLDEAIDSLPQMHSSYRERIDAIRNEGYLIRSLPY